MYTYWMTAARREYWQHTPSGRIWAVEFSGSRVARCCGPIFAEDVDARLLNHLLYDDRLVPWITAHRREFRRFEDRPGRPALAG